MQIIKDVTAVIMFISGWDCIKSIKFSFDITIPVTKAVIKSWKATMPRTFLTNPIRSEVFLKKESSELISIGKG